MKRDLLSTTSRLALVEPPPSMWVYVGDEHEATITDYDDRNGMITIDVETRCRWCKTRIREGFAHVCGPRGLIPSTATPREFIS